MQGAETCTDKRKWRAWKLQETLADTSLLFYLLEIPSFKSCTTRKTNEWLPICQPSAKNFCIAKVFKEGRKQRLMTFICLCSDITLNELKKHRRTGCEGSEMHSF